MMVGIHYIQQPGNLAAMKKDLPVHFVAGKEDPVGSYGKGVEQACAAFKKAGMQDISIRIYADGRHEMLNELNKEEVYKDLLNWIEKKI
jgi:alpha-beta hydrolase superfamily lysophospholipase